MFLLSLCSGWLRRLLGGWCSKVPVIKERGVQWLLCFLLYAPTIYFCTYHTHLAEWLPKWIFTLLATFCVIWAETKAHFPGFQCGCESLDYINECIAKGRKIHFEKFVDWIGEKRGFEKWGREWCFWQLLCCKTVYLCVPALFVGGQLLLVGIITACAYNCFYWVQMKDFKKLLTSPTNWGEFVQGMFIYLGLVL